MHYIKFEKNWSSGHQEEVKNVQILTDTIYHVCPPLGENRYPEDYKFHNFGKGFLALHHHAFSFSSTCAVVEKIFEIGQLWVVCAPPPRPQGGRNHKIHNFCSPSPIDAISQICLKLVQRFQRRS
jgi:hypothetical protein